MAAQPTPSRRGLFDAEVTANLRICEGHYRLCLRVAGFPPTRPGQFVNLQCRHGGGRIVQLMTPKKWNGQFITVKPPLHPE